MSWQSEVKQRNYKVLKNGTDFEKTSRQSEIVWKDSTELGMARAKTPDGKITYVVGRYRPAGNMMGNFEGNVLKSKSKDPPSFIKSSGHSNGQQESRVVERSWEGKGNPGQQQTRVIVRETRTQTPEGVKTVKSTTTWTTSSNVQMKPTGKSDRVEIPSTKFRSLNISDGRKASDGQKPSDGRKPAEGQKPAAKPSASQQSAKSSGSFKEQALKMHNQYRRLHQVSDVRWNDELARQAQAWAEKIARQNTLRHASQQERNGDGENLAFFGGKFGDVATDAVNMWYSEEKKYQYRNAGFQSGTGHFTQVVWKDSKEVGMGFAKTPDGRSVYIVGRYRPAGNMMGSFEQNVFPPKK